MAWVLSCLSVFPIFSDVLPSNWVDKNLSIFSFNALFLKFQICHTCNLKWINFLICWQNFHLHTWNFPKRYTSTLTKNMNQIHFLRNSHLFYDENFVSVCVWLLLPLHHLCGFLDCYSVIDINWMLTAGLIFIWTTWPFSVQP